LLCKFFLLSSREGTIGYGVNHRAMMQTLIIASGKIDTVRGDVRWKDISSMGRAVYVDFNGISAV